MTYSSKLNTMSLKKNMSGNNKLDFLEFVALEAAQNTIFVHDDLGIKGTQSITINQFGEKALICDVECENAIIKVLSKNGLSGKVYSEEHGIFDVGNEKQYTIVIDGLDGSYNYKKSFSQARYATMFAVFESLNPKYRQYLLSVIIEHAKKELYLALKGKGAFLFLPV